MIRRIVFRAGNVINVIALNKTTNKKIALPTEWIVQTYHFSADQFVNAQTQTTMKTFFSHDKANCFDCPFAVSNGAKLQACYTHKLRQYTGFLSMLRSIGKQYQSFDDIPEYTDDVRKYAIAISCDRYVRFGTYGEPTCLPLDLVDPMARYSKTYTGYTHRWSILPEYAPYFMASTHNADQTRTASLIGYRSFQIVADTNYTDDLIHCPASAESEFKSYCSKCNLCSGSKGKGIKSVAIVNH